MENNILFQLCLITIVSGTANFPQVYEDQIEYNRNNEYIRIVRNPQLRFNPRTYQPQIFHFGTAKQQDYLRNRYAEQQMVDMARIASLQANREHYAKPQIPGVIYHPVRRSKKDTEGWQPFDPNMPKTTMEQTTTSKNATSQTGDETVNKAEDITTVTEGKDNIKRSDSPDTLKSAIFIHPNLLMHNLNKKNVPQMLDLTGKHSTNQLTMLNELIGKNPNVQLEGLKRLLQEPSNENHLPVVEGPKPFQLKDQTPIAEKLVDIANTQDKPNIQVQGIYPEVRLPELPAVINRESLEDLQKQFDDASKLQIEQALARAQEEAQAQVEAQHKAIALAQAEAQKVALENFEKSLYTLADPTAAPPQVQVSVKPQASHVSSVSLNKPVTPSSYPPRMQKQDLAEQELQDISSEHRPQLVNLPIPHEQQASPQLHNPRQTYYAPRHHHQGPGQLQDEKGFLIRPQAQSVTILEKPSDQSEAIETNEEVNNHDDLIVIHTTSRPEAINDGFQSIANHEENRRVKKLYVSEEDGSYDEPEELQYAARYAFGYRIKDAEEGNDFGHEERRNGKSAEGSYHVLLPDGRLQKVQYYADKTGYHAKVTYEQVGHK